MPVSARSSDLPIIIIPVHHQEGEGDQRNTINVNYIV